MDQASSKDQAPALDKVSSKDQTPAKDQAPPKDQGPPVKAPAFPGAEGFGAWTPGGRGGKVLFVTNLKDFIPGKEPLIPGSLRGAIMGKGPRTVIFRVSGTITLKARLDITEPYITLAGQSAPGDGVCLGGYGAMVKKTHDVIIRHLRFRPGDLVGKALAKQGKKWETDALSVYDSKDVIIDHVSASWANDEVLSVTHGTRVTVQWSFITESLNDSTHPKGKHGYGGLVAYMEDGEVSQHHNLWAFHISRCPRPGSTLNCKGPGLLYDFRYNVVHMGGKGYSASGYDKIRMNYFGNTITKSAVFAATPGVSIYKGHNWHNGKNTGWSMFTGSFNKATKPFAVAPLKADTPQNAYAAVLGTAGASLPKRDAVDSRVAAATKAQKGKIIDSQADVGGWPLLKSAAPPADADADGMPDAWETNAGLNPKQAADRNADPDGDGYTNLEEWLNGTNPKVKD